ncbi:hypothetical protein BOX15_Mlig032908g1, partial [Macrostomum lignano]
ARQIMSNCSIMLSGILAHVADFDRLYINLDKEANDLAQVQQLVEACSKPAVPVPGELFAACYEGSLYRGMCIRAGQEDALIHFLDFGNTERVPLNQIFELPAGLLQTSPPLVRCCSLEGLLAIDEEAALDEITRLALEQPVTLRLSDSTDCGQAAIVVEDLLDKAGQSVSERLIELRLVRRYKPVRYGNQQAAGTAPVVAMRPITNINAALCDENSNLPINELSLAKQTANALKFCKSNDLLKPPSNETKWPSNEIKPLINEAKSPSNEAKSPSNNAKLPSNDAKPPSNEAKPPNNEAKPPSNEIEPPGNEIKPPGDKLHCIYSGPLKLTHIVSPSEFYCILPGAPPSPPAPPLTYKKPAHLVSLADQNEIDVNSVYLGQYSHDPTRRYHRMRLLRLNLSNATATVLLVDFGYVETCKSLSEIYVVPPTDAELAAFMTAPTRASLCRLRGLAVGALPGLTSKAVCLMRRLADPSWADLKESGGAAATTSAVSAYADVYSSESGGLPCYPVDLHVSGSGNSGCLMASQLISAGLAMRE